VRRTEEGWQERFVTLESDHFAFVDLPLSSPTLAEYVESHLEEMPVNSVTEVNLEARDWIRSLSNKLNRGFVLIVDYGWVRADYYSPHRTAGTLEASGNHRREPDPLARPGELDLTAHVDFTSIAETAEATGMRVAGFGDQHHFLVGLSRLHFTEGTRPDPREMRAFQTLAHPTMLGRAFKVLCLGKEEESLPLSGFAFSSDPRAVLGLPD
jgi:SAM-dependent MidA family methyltransferase